jgi:hypothetical protein
MDTFSLILLIAAASFVVIWIASRFEKKRQRAFIALAQSRGLSYSRHADLDVERELKDYNLFGSGRKRQLGNYVRGKIDNISLRFFDYHYETGDGQSSKKHSKTVLIMQANKLNLPVFVLCPENIFHEAASLLGYQDVDFQSHREFSKAYLLRGKDERAINRTFTDPILTYFGRHPGLHVEGKGDTLLYYSSNRLIKPEEIQPFLMEGLQVFQLFTPHLS